MVIATPATLDERQDVTPTITAFKTVEHRPPLREKPGPSIRGLAHKGVQMVETRNADGCHRPDLRRCVLDCDATLAKCRGIDRAAVADCGLVASLGAGSG
jgi:hypothetical protein